MPLKSFLIYLTLILAACGYKGPLTLPSTDSQNIHAVNKPTTLSVGPHN
ncbi:MAG: hypothetical protein DI619_04950 [Francisella sp.]|nr:MAG: hypothetical protein DI619_04950 [Francisella sp.]